jgi:hypothetical protein
MEADHDHAAAVKIAVAAVTVMACVIIRTKHLPCQGTKQGDKITP